MNEWEIEVIHTPSGQYFTMLGYYEDDCESDLVWEDISNNLSINVRKVEND